MWPHCHKQGGYRRVLAILHLSADTPAVMKLIITQSNMQFPDQSTYASGRNVTEVLYHLPDVACALISIQVSQWGNCITLSSARRLLLATSCKPSCGL
jgi:hypothetical protein